MKRLAFVAVVLATLLAAACSKGFSSGSDVSSEPRTGRGVTRVATAGGVEVEGTWLTEDDLDDVDADLAAHPLDEFVLVKIQFTTHSGDLNQIDMEEASVLRQGEADEQPTGWISLSDDSHHREGILVFQRADGEGPAELTLDLGSEKVALLWEAVPAG